MAEAIRIKLGASSRQRRDEKQKELNQSLERLRDLRQQLVAAEGRIAKLASINEGLVMENKVLQASVSNSKVVSIR